jgi:hypothetical protein
MINDPNQFTHDAWKPTRNLGLRMGDNGNDFFNFLCWPRSSLSLTFNQVAVISMPGNA